MVRISFRLGANFLFLQLIEIDLSVYINSIYVIALGIRPKDNFFIWGLVKANKLSSLSPSKADCNFA